jgi:hypothetical protein
VWCRKVRRTAARAHRKNVLTVTRIDETISSSPDSKPHGELLGLDGDDGSGKRKLTRTASKASRIADRDTGLRPSPTTLLTPRQKGTRSALLTDLERGTEDGDSGGSGHRGTTRTSERRSKEKRSTGKRLRGNSGLSSLCASVHPTRARLITATPRHATPRRSAKTSAHCRPAWRSGLGHRGHERRP